MRTADLPPYRRRFFDAPERATVIGSGSIGGKAHGLVGIRDALDEQLDGTAFPGIRIAIPRFTVLSAELFEEFVRHNRLDPAEMALLSDEKIALAFQQADLPATIVGDLRSIVEQARTPLAVRSSSLLEDAMYRPFAGVYATKMIPNHQSDPAGRFRRLVEAIKFVYASTWFRAARAYIEATDRDPAEEKMAVVIQEVIGRQHGGPPGPGSVVRSTFYPDLSGVARSYNFYPAGGARPKEGVVSLALGLGKTIVDGGRSWTYSPAAPRANPPYNTLRDLMQQTQTSFWGVNMGQPREYDPTRETEYLVEDDLEAAEADGVLAMLASTYSVESDRLVMGTGAQGPRVLTFAPLLVLERVPLNAAVTALLACCEHRLGNEVEIEFAVTFHKDSEWPARLGFLQVRPLVVSGGEVEIPPETLASDEAVVATEQALGNGAIESIRDIVYLNPERFDRARTADMAVELETVNRALAAERRPYLLIGFGRWGSADPWLGVPVQWGQISGARAIVEASLPDLPTDPSQGSHFFHNLTSFRVLYFTVPRGHEGAFGSGAVGHDGAFGSGAAGNERTFGGGAAGKEGAFGSGTARRRSERIDWEWLRQRPAHRDLQFVRHVRLEAPLRAVVDGRTGRGAILKASD